MTGNFTPSEPESQPPQFPSVAELGDRAENSPRLVAKIRQINMLSTLVSWSDENCRVEDDHLSGKIRDILGCRQAQYDATIRRLRRLGCVSAEGIGMGKRLKAATLYPRAIRRAMLEGELLENEGLLQQLNEKFPTTVDETAAPQTSKPLPAVRPVAPVVTRIDPERINHPRQTPADVRPESPSKIQGKNMRIEFKIAGTTVKFLGNAGKFMKLSDQAKILLAMGNAPRIIGQADPGVQLAFATRYVNKGLPRSKGKSPEEVRKLVGAEVESGNLEQLKNGQWRLTETEKTALILTESLDTVKSKSGGFNDGSFIEEIDDDEIEDAQAA